MPKSAAAAAPSATPAVSVAPELARRIVALRREDLPPVVAQNAQIAILDTLGVALAGASEDCARLLLESGVVSDGPCRVLGGTRKLGALDAALVNGTAVHALDFDDVNIALGGHPSAPIVPALLAIADTMPVAGRDFITAYVAGFETTTRIARGVNYHHYEKGWHPTVTLGVFGATAASARLLQLDAERTAVALAIATSLASGIKANFGTMVKPLHVGHCARSGLFAALLAKGGYTANPAAFEHRQGFFEVYNGAGTYDPAAIFEHWAQPFDIERPGLGIKLYPCCGSAHCSIDGMLNLIARHDLRADDVAKVHARIHARRLVHINRPDPQSALEAKFSVHYCLARALNERRVVMDHFEGEAYRDAATRELMRRITVEPYTNPPPDKGDHYAVELTVTLKSGATHALRQEKPCGRAPEDPTPSDRLRAKFESGAARALGAARAAALYDALANLDASADVARIVDRMAG